MGKGNKHWIKAIRQLDSLRETLNHLKLTAQQRRILTSKISIILASLKPVAPKTTRQKSDAPEIFGYSAMQLPDGTIIGRRF